MNEELVKNKMVQVFELVQRDIATIRTGRVTPALVENIGVSVYGGTDKLRIVELGTITAPDNQSLVIDPWDKSIIGEIRQGILLANAGLNPSIDGEVIRIILPPLTTEDREKYVKLLSSKIESGRVMIRQIRGDTMRDIKKEYEGKRISEDQKFGQEKRLQGLVDEFVSKIEGIGAQKQKELLQI